jgi:hypothetical protein
MSRPWISPAMRTTVRARAGDRFDHGRIVALTPVGRATARLLNFSDHDREEARRKLWLAGHYQL